MMMSNGKLIHSAVDPFAVSHWRGAVLISVSLPLISFDAIGSLPSYYDVFAPAAVYSMEMHGSENVPQ